MATADSAIIDDFLNAFQTQVDSGFGLISGDVSAVFGALVILSVGATAVLWAVDETGNVTAALIRKVLLVGFFAWLIANWSSLSVLVVDGFAALGLKAGSGSLSLADFMGSPTKVIGLGFTDAFALLAYIGQLCQQGAGLGLFVHFDVIFIAAAAALGIIIAFIVLAVEVAVTIIEFHIVTLIAFVTIPFGVLAQTAFMSERSMGYVVSVGAKLMALAIVVSIGESVFKTYVVSAAPTAAEECGLLLASILMATLALKIPAVAGALASGGPQLNAGAAFAGAAGVAAGVSGVLLGGRLAGSMLGKGLQNAAGKAAAANAAAWSLPSALREGSAQKGGPSASAGGQGLAGAGASFVGAAAQTGRRALKAADEGAPASGMKPTIHPSKDDQSQEEGA